LSERSQSNARVQEVGGDVSLLPEPVQTVVVVDTSQGIIDNGGLEYFYESDLVGAGAPLNIIRYAS
jgi:hypothetical protein